ncbi:MAG TPA: hypothetical protein VJ965_07880, partial [Anaerolineales bacterium]|nr:hypothetical protein [Anaerolineales bacterium]
MSVEIVQGLIDALGRQFGQYDNEVGQWAAHSEALAGFFPQVEAGLAASFAVNGAPLPIFARAVETYTGLLDALPAHDLSPEDLKIAAGYLNLRFYIYLNGFLQACAESLEKV